VSYWVIAILGIIEGLTEFLPVSSTGHLLLAEHALKLPAQPTELFNVVIQSGAVLAVLAVFGGRLKQMARDWKTPAVRDYSLKLVAAFVLTAIGGLILKKIFPGLPETATPVAIATLVGGIVILVVERFLGRHEGTVSVSWAMALTIGLSQLLAVCFPGTSRSGATIMAGMIMGLNRPAATEFSFLLGVPTLLAAGGYKVLSALRHPGEAHEPWMQLVLGTVVAALTAFVVVRWLLRYVQNHTFVLFGWYRIILGGLILLFAYLNYR
jgi:undecaprenyl-diphosphatase